MVNHSRRTLYEFFKEVFCQLESKIKKVEGIENVNHSIFILNRRGALLFKRRLLIFHIMKY